MAGPSEGTNLILRSVRVEPTATTSRSLLSVVPRYVAVRLRRVPVLAQWLLWVSRPALERSELALVEGGGARRSAKIISIWPAQSLGARTGPNPLVPDSFRVSSSPRAGYGVIPRRTRCGSGWPLVGPSSASREQTPQYWITPGQTVSRSHETSTETFKRADAAPPSRR